MTIKRYNLTSDNTKGQVSSLRSNMNHSSRSVLVDGSVIRNFRIERGWNQSELGRRAGYTARLIRKAESGGPIDLETLSNLAEALSTPDKPISPKQLSLTKDLGFSATSVELQSQLTSRHLEIARTFVRCYDDGGRNTLAHCGSLFTEDFEFHCPAEREFVPFAGVWRAVQGLQDFFNAFYGVFTRRCNSLVPEYLSSESQVVARFIDQVYFQGHELPEYWVNLHFQFRDGLCFRVDDEFDHYSAKRSFEELLQRLSTETPPGE